MSEDVYLLAGEEFLVGEALDKIRTEAGTDHLSEVTLDASATAGEIRSALESPSLLGGRRLVVVTAAHELKKSQLDELQSYLSSPSPHALLVLVAAGKGRLASVVKDRGAVVSLEAPKGRNLVRWIRQQASSHGLGFDDRAGWALIDAVGPDLRDLDAALSQSAAALGSGARVTATDVRRLFPRRADQRMFVLTDALGERRLEDAMAALRRLLEQGDEPLMVFGAIAAHFRRMLIARGHAEGGPAAVGAALGLPEWRAERLVRQVRAYREEELTHALAVLHETDLEMKGGDLPPDLALERALVLIASPSRRASAVQA
jgi:DNA polymerase III subunit delta